MQTEALSTGNVREKIRSKMETSFHRRASIKKNKLTDDLNLEKALDENIFIMGHIMLDLHETFEVSPNYEMLTEFEHFKTPANILTYMEDRLNQQKR